MQNMDDGNRIYGMQVLRGGGTITGVSELRLDNRDVELGKRRTQLTGNTDNIMEPGPQLPRSIVRSTDY